MNVTGVVGTDMPLTVETDVDSPLQDGPGGDVHGHGDRAGGMGKMGAVPETAHCPIEIAMAAVLPWDYGGRE